ncbi:MAG: hypothetical protein Q7S08_02530 [bacterium]|nr:hypothetical protein [bacterium]
MATHQQHQEVAAMVFEALQNWRRGNRGAASEGFLRAEQTALANGLSAANLIMEVKSLMGL